jgi:hypothetical protein
MVCKLFKATGLGAAGVDGFKETSVKEDELKSLNAAEAGGMTDVNADKFIGWIAEHGFRNRKQQILIKLKS